MRSESSWLETAPYDARNLSHIKAFARELLAVAPEHRPQIAAAIQSLKLMTPPLYLRVAVWFRVKVLRDIGEHDLWLGILLKYPALAEELLKQTAEWAINGKDRFDPSSVGGFCQLEINVLYGLLEIDRKYREIGTHMTHCNQGDYLDSCAYGEHENCPAMKENNSEN